MPELNLDDLEALFRAFAEEYPDNTSNDLCYPHNFGALYDACRKVPALIERVRKAEADNGDIARRQSVRIGLQRDELGWRLRKAKSDMEILRGENSALGVQLKAALGDWKTEHAEVERLNTTITNMAMAASKACVMCPHDQNDCHEGTDCVTRRILNLADSSSKALEGGDE
jgi:hypothetical protein